MFRDFSVQVKCLFQNRTSLVSVGEHRDAAGHVLSYAVMDLDLLVISAARIRSYQTWLRLSPSYESSLGVDMMYFSRASSGQTRSPTTVAKLFRVNLSPKGTGVEQWQFGGCVIARTVVIWVIIEPARYITMQHIPAPALNLLQAWKPIKMHWRKWQSGRNDLRRKRLQTELSSLAQRGHF